MIQHMGGAAPYPSKVVRRWPWSTLSYAFQRSSKIRKRGSWSKIANSCTILSSMISIPIPLPSQKLCRTSWRRTLVLRRVSMIASTTFHSNYNRPMPQVSMFLLFLLGSPRFATQTELYPPASATSPDCGGGASPQMDTPPGSIS